MVLKIRLNAEKRTSGTTEIQREKIGLQIGVKKHSISFQFPFIPPFCHKANICVRI